MVNQHPQPVDDCPCFEDAIAFVSVLMGSLLARWHAVHYGFDERFFTSMMPGSAGQTWDDVSVWWWFAVSKMVVGKRYMFSFSCIYSTLKQNVYRDRGNIYLANTRKIYAPYASAPDVPPPLPCVHTPKPAVLHARNRLWECTERVGVEADTECDGLVWRAWLWPWGDEWCEERGRDGSGAGCWE